jgi:hypothetical protein
MIDVPISLHSSMTLCFIDRCQDEALVLLALKTAGGLSGKTGRGALAWPTKTGRPADLQLQSLGHS